MNDDLREIEQYREDAEYQQYKDEQNEESYRAEAEPEPDEDVLFSVFDIALINGTRSLLAKLANDKPPVSTEAGWLREWNIRSFGNVQGQAEIIEYLLFQLLNYSRHHLNVEMTDEQLHNSAEEGA